ncbi:MAG: hypothetical protein ACD_49C00009G0050 [uncultured bacterium (gcode 4)]|uniref:Transmembrane protein n=1 Tax=uncultured bacterium (gcode 4) TaxID=1234023 RepID=K2AFN2_9BACT|nr:MAG: hypothetical protein ACD_49C00009G0050 [uncultured bacterium (gcode 4)]
MRSETSALGVKKLKLFILASSLFLNLFIFNYASADFLGDFKDNVKGQFNWEWLKNEMIVRPRQTSIATPSTKVDLSLWVDENSVNFDDNFIKVVERYIFWLLWMASVAVFMYIWFLLFSAEWKEENLKKWMKSLVYTWIWLAVIPLSWILIKIVTWFNF